MKWEGSHNRQVTGFVQSGVLISGKMYEMRGFISGKMYICICFISEKV